MHKRQWKQLVPGTTYIFTPGDGWAFTLNEDGSANLAYAGSGDSDAKSVDLSVDPDPGQGDKYPPTEP